MANLDEIRQQLDLLSDEELLSILQEHDVEQWRPEVFDIVGSILNARGVSPDTQHEEDVVDETNGLDLATVAEYFNYSDAEIDRLALESEGLKAWIFTEEDPPTQDSPGVRLQVLPKDLAAARRIFESESEPELVPSSDLPPEIAEPPCPKCGSRKVTEQPEVMESQTSHGLSPTQTWLYHCASCGHKWSG